MFAWPGENEPGASIRVLEIQGTGPLKPHQVFQTIEVVGRAPHFQKDPKGFSVDAELLEVFEDKYTGTYTTPSFKKIDHWKAIGRYEQFQTVPDRFVLNRAISWVTKILKPHIDGYGIATHQQVVDNWDRNTSTGFPYCEVYPTKGEFLDAYGSEFLEIAWSYWCKQPYRGNWKQFLKEELRKTGKDTRGVVCAPLDINYNMSRLFLNFNKLFYEACLKIPSAVGISRDGLEWNKLYNKLKRFPRGFAIDFKQFDSKMTTDLLRAVCTIRKNLLHAKYKDFLFLFDAAYEELDSTYIIVDGYLLRKAGGNPSGSNGTTVDNCIAHMIQVFYAFIILNPTLTFEECKELLVFIVYGDDNVTSADFDKISFKPEDIHSVLHAAFGSTITCDGIKDVESLDFLSANFAFTSVAGQQVAVPLMDPEKMICHIVEANDSTLSQKFQRIVSLRDICVWDDVISERLTGWLQDHKHYVTPEDYNNWVQPIQQIRARYVLPKKKFVEPIVLQGIKKVLKPERGHFKETLMSSADNRTGAYSAKVAKMLDAAHVTEAGRTFVKNVLNPFPDYPLVKVPAVDEGQSSVLPCVAQLEKTVTMPQSLIDAGVKNWDLFVWHPGNLVPNEFLDKDGVHYIPLVADIIYAGETMVDVHDEGAGHNYYPLQPISWIAVPSGKDVFPQDATWIAPAADCFGGMNFNPWLDNGAARITALAMEGRNITPPLYQSGIVVTGMIPQQPELLDQKTRVHDLGFHPTWIEAEEPAYLFAGPPSNIAQAKNTEGSLQWEAIEGHYSVCRPTKEFRDLKPTQNACSIWAQHWPNPQGGDYPKPGEVCVFTDAVHVPRTYTILEAEYGYISNFRPPMRPSGFSSSFAYYAGLSPETKISFLANAIIEKVPDFGSVTEMSFAVRSGNYDPAALELISKAFNDLPYAVPVAENDLGEWFGKAMKAVEKYAPTIGTGLGALGVPGAGLIGNALASGAKVYNEKTKNMDPKPKAASKPKAPPSAEAVLRPKRKKRANTVTKVKRSPQGG